MGRYAERNFVYSINASQKIYVVSDISQNSALAYDFFML